MDLTKIFDIDKLKSLKSDEHDKIANAQQVINVSTQNINIIIGRIQELEAKSGKPTATKPAKRARKR